MAIFSLHLAGAAVKRLARLVAGVVYAVVLPAVLRVVGLQGGVAQVGPAVGSLFIHLMPVFASILSALVLGETPAWYHYAGMALVFGGILLTARKPAPALAVSPVSAR